MKEKIRYRWYLRQQLQILHRKDQESWSSYDEKFYKANQCLGGCPTNAQCEWGICECKEGFQRAWGGCHNLVGWSLFKKTCLVKTLICSQSRIALYLSHLSLKPKQILVKQARIAFSVT